MSKREGWMKMEACFYHHPLYLDEMKACVHPKMFSFEIVILENRAREIQRLMFRDRLIYTVILLLHRFY